MAILIDELRDPEIEDLRALAADGFRIGDDEHVVGLQIAVNDARGVCGVQRQRDLACESQRVHLGKSAVATQSREQRFADEVLHHDERDAFVVAEVEDLDDSRIGNARRRPGLLESAPITSLRTENAGTQYLIAY